jgi:hypothetical protein
LKDLTEAAVSASRASVKNTPRRSTVKSLVAIIVSAVVMAFAGAAIAAEDTPQPLTRAACEQAGMKWNDRANVCAGHRHHDKMKKKKKKAKKKAKRAH